MSDQLTVRAYARGDRAELARLYRAMFPDPDVDADAELSRLEAQLPERTGLFVLARRDGTLGGFLEVGTRPYAEGCDSSPVGYVEAWYVEAALRRRGCGARLVAAAEAWTRARGLVELASDTLIDNLVSIDAHRRLGFDEIERIVCFRKRL
jgi:aminoglycoside 6'-N-acetyltransferase I